MDDERVSKRTENYRRLGQGLKTFHEGGRHPDVEYVLRGRERKASLTFSQHCRYPGTGCESGGVLDMEAVLEGRGCQRREAAVLGR